MDYSEMENESGAFDGELFAEYVDFLHDQEKDRLMEESMKKEEEENASI